MLRERPSGQRPTGQSPTGPSRAARAAAHAAAGAVLIAVAASLAGCGAAARGAATTDTAPLTHPVQRAARITHDRITQDRIGDVHGVPDVPGELAQPRSSGDLTLADGEVPAGTTVLDGTVPAVAKLDPALEAALRAAAEDAARVGLQLVVNSGWRSLAYQRELFDQAIDEYGSEAEAARWVARPGTSVHEAGEAVDLGPAATTAWLAEHGASYGLCRIYANESWHFELRPAAVSDGCPQMYADAAHDPRMQR